MMQPPDAGIFSPSIQFGLVVASSIGLMIGTPMPKAQPRLSPDPPHGHRCLPLRFRRSGYSSVRPPQVERIGPMYVVLVPVKPPSVGKSRLVGLPDDARRELATAFALDTVAAALQASLVDAVLVVTDDAVLASQLSALGCAAVPDGVTGDLNATLRQAAAEADRRWPDSVPAAVCADLPALQASELDTALGQVERGEPAYVADASGEGTTLYAASYDRFAPRFGPMSARAHAGDGARALTCDVPGLRRDVDDLDDLRAALELGVGPETRRRAASLAGDGPS